MACVVLRTGFKPKSVPSRAGGRETHAARAPGGRGKSRKILKEKEEGQLPMLGEVHSKKK